MKKIFALLLALCCLLLLFAGCSHFYHSTRKCASCQGNGRRRKCDGKGTY